ncbi:hypothetical protein E2C01_022167 [Portunus trituberculatus]|uniref:Uncharacterized protein n=1 Tax=Portunus trituberculatus TaxID=210409 RepID=A0A5B7E4P6_PORTR|nr:hypothetical protein [Portunus trituberculatus]
MQKQHITLRFLQILVIYKFTKLPPDHEVPNHALITSSSDPRDTRPPIRMVPQKITTSSLPTTTTITSQVVVWQGEGAK